MAKFESAAALVSKCQEHTQFSVSLSNKVVFTESGLIDRDLKDEETADDCLLKTDATDFLLNKRDLKS